VTLDRCTESQDLVVADRAIDILSGTVEAGTVSGQHFRWAGRAAGRDLISIDTWWWVGGARPPSYPARRPDGWSIDIEGSPSMRLSMLALGSLDPASPLPIKAHVDAASVATAMHAVNAIPVSARRNREFGPSSTSRLSPAGGSASPRAPRTPNRRGAGPARRRT